MRRHWTGWVRLPGTSMSWSPVMGPSPRVPRWRPALPPIMPTSTRCAEEGNRPTRAWVKTGSPASTSRTWSRPGRPRVLGVDWTGAGWWAGRMAGPVGFVGREGELSALLGALGGDARLVLVVGDAGVGKTRFVAEGMGRAAAAGMVMVRGECLPLAGALPLLPVAGALGELDRLDGGKVLAAALDAAPGYVRAEVARLLPGLGEGGETSPGGRDEEWSLGRLLSAVAE